jgi:hypothetical protein
MRFLGKILGLFFLIGISLSFCSSSKAQTAYVKGCTGSNGPVSSIACAFSGNVTNGDIIACPLIVWDGSLTWSSLAKSSGTATVGTFQDWSSGGATLTVISSGAERATMGYALVTGTGTATITNTVTGGTGNLDLICQDISGGVTSSPLDASALVAQSAPGTGTDGVKTSPNQTTTVSGDYLAGGMWDIEGNSSTMAAGTNYTLRDSINAGGRTSESQIQAAASSSTIASGTATGGGADVWFVGLMAFKPASAPTTQGSGIGGSAGIGGKAGIGL